MIKNKVSNILQILPENMTICVEDIWAYMEKTEFLVKDSKDVNKIILNSTIDRIIVNYTDNICKIEIW